MSSTFQKQHILYELFVYAEWRPDPDFIRGEIAKETNTPFLEHVVAILKSETLHENISSFVNQLQPWQICLGDDGKVVAILQDCVLEIRTKRGNFSTIVARSGVPRDPNPQWRKMVWSPDCSVLAVSQSNGNVAFYDLMATNLFTIESDHIQQSELLFTDSTYAISGIVFLTSRVDRKGIKQKWSSEVLLVDYKGCLRSYFLSPTDGFLANHTFHFEGGVSTITHHPSHNMLFVTGLPGYQKDPKKSSFYGLQGWRLLNDSPFYKLSIDSDALLANSFTSLVSSYIFPTWKKNNQSIITRASSSANGRLLSCLHLNGSVSLWSLPALKFLKLWHLTNQPNFNLKSPLVPIGKHKVWPTFHAENAEFIPIDLSWWSEEALIISRLNGSVTVCSIDNFDNLLGDNPEFLQGHPQITNTFDNGFLSLECEAMLVSAKKLRRDSETSELPTGSVIEKSEDAGDSSDDEKVSFRSRSTEVIKTALYIITDMERFQPKPKKLHLLSRVYRLLCLRSTTPEDLYARKIENGDFTEALTLAQSYNLDTDLVYQQQWRTSPVSHQSIKDYLSKVSKKIWVIQQCCDRVPEALTAAKELLEFGLEISNEEMIKGIVNKKQSKSTLNKLTVSDLSTQQTEILRYRHTMLFYLDRLEIYKAIMKCEYSTYSSEEYNNLRVNSITNSAINLARNGRVQALGCLWPHLTQTVQELLVLQNLPETLDPNEYKILLPSIEKRDVHKYPKAIMREKDWCENIAFKDIWDSNVWSDDIDATNQDGESENILPSVDLTEWYTNRAKEIEKYSGSSHNALKLIEVAQEGQIPGLDVLKHLLLTLDTLIYSVGVHDMTLQCLEGCSPFQILKYLMSKATETSVVSDVKYILYPYLTRCQKLSDTPNLKDILFKEYVINTAKENLILPIMILENSNELSLCTKTCLDLVEGCLSAQDSLEQLSLCFQLLRTLCKERDNSVPPSHYVRAYEEMKQNLDACSLLQAHNVCMSYSELKTMSSNPKEAMDILKNVANNTSKRNTVSSEAWNKLLAHILELQSKVFQCVEVESCYEIYGLSLLSSCNKMSIQSAKHVLTCHPSKDPSPPMESYPLEKAMSTHRISVSQKVPYDRSISLILEAAVKYFNSASSISDVSLDYAWTCLQLIKQENYDIDNERDLLLALKIIEEFDSSILPIQVRLYSPKFGLIEDCLNCNNKAYKSVDKLIHLAKLLRISSDNEKQREIIIVALCAEKAADNEDYETCQTLCRRLLTATANIEPGTEKAERAARRLGADPRLTDSILRKDLLNLALLYCEPQHIENIIQTRSFVESEILKTEMNNLINVVTCKFNVRQQPVNLQDSVDSTDDDYVDALTSPQNENKSILYATQVLEKYIHKPLLTLSDRSSWKEVLNISWLIEKNEPEEEDVKLTLKDSKITCPYFYSSLHRECHVSNIFTQYDKLTTPDMTDKQLLLLQVLIRNYFLQDTVNYGSSQNSPDEVLMQCAEKILSDETALFISLLLSISDPNVFDKILHKSFLDVKTITSVLYFCVLYNYIEENNIPDEAFFLPPAKLLHSVISNIKIEECESKKSVEFIINCKNRFIELLEGEKLNSMGCNVDIRQFIDDDVYRKDTIINISKTLNKDTYALALELADKYNIDKVDIALSYLSHVLLNFSDIGFTETMNIISQSSLIDLLNTNSAKTVEGLFNGVWDNMNGSDIQHTLAFFNVLAKIDESHNFKKLSIKEHIKLIKKVKSACPELNYKFLLESPSASELIDHILPLLTNENIGLISKLMRNLPQCLNVTFDSSSLHYKWILKYFFNVPENLQNPKKWMQQYRDCSTFFNKLKKEDLISLIEYILFSSEAIDILPVKTRIQIAHQTAELCNEFSNEDVKSNTSRSWLEIGEDIATWGRFIENLYSDDVQNVFKRLNINKEIYRCIENSQGQKSDLIQSLQTLLKCYEVTFDEFSLLIETLSNDSLCYDEIILDVLNQPNLDRCTIVNVVKMVKSARNKDIGIDNEILSKLKPYTSCTILSSEEKLEILSLFKTSYNEDTDILIQITKDMIHNTWNQDEISGLDDDIIQNEEKRDRILIQLIDSADTWNKLHVLIEIVKMWTNKSASHENITDPCLHLVAKLIKNDTAIENNIPLLKVLLENNNIQEDDLRKILSKDNSCHVIGKIWLCVLSNHPNVLPSVIAEEENISQYDTHLDDNLISAMLSKRMLIHVVNTVLYPKCVQYLLSRDCSEEGDAYTIDMAIGELMANNYIAEAGTLKMASMRIPQTLRNFTQAIKFMRK